MKTVFGQETPVKATLDELGATIRSEYAAMHSHAIGFLDHAIRCGDALLQARELIGNQTGHIGEGWTVWLAENAGFTYSTASNMMRLAYYREHIPAEAGLALGVARLQGLRRENGSIAA